MKELEKTFIGRGEVRGFVFTQKEKTETGYIYEVQNGDYTYFEVFAKKINRRFGGVCYPTSAAFGVWAWWCESHQKAIEIMNDRVSLVGVSKSKKRQIAT